MRALCAEVLSGLTRETAVRGLQQQRVSDRLNGKYTRGSEQKDNEGGIIHQSWGS